MAERYTRLMSLDNSRWHIESPVIFEKGALLYDALTQMNLLQLQFRNVGSKDILAMAITVDAYDILSEELLETCTFQYLDLEAKSQNFFGSNIPVLLKETQARRFVIFIQRVVFADGTSQELSLHLTEVEPRKGIETLGEFRKQFEIEAKKLNPALKCTTLPKQYEQYWYCACGGLNTREESTCHICGSAIEQLLTLTDTEYLTAQEQKAKEQEKQSERNEIKKANRNALIIGGIAMLLIVFGVMFLLLIPDYDSRRLFSSAQTAYHKEEYLLACSLYAQLPDNEKAQETLQKMEFPLEGVWSRSRRSDIYLTSEQFYFSAEHVLVARSSNKLSEERAFKNAHEYSFVSWSVREDGIFELSFGMFDYKIAVVSDDCIHLFYNLEQYDANNPETYQIYYRTNDSVY